MTSRFLVLLAVAASLSAAAAPAAAVPMVASAADAAPAVAAAPAHAGPAAALAQAQPVAGPAAGSLLQTILALCLVLALLAGLAWFLKRYGPKAAGGSAQLRIVGALSLGGRERIMVVEVGDQWIVVGASPGRVNALATMPKQETGQPQGGALLHPQLPPASSFAEWLKQTIDQRNAQ